MRAVLFDLDGTLLDIDLDAFLRRYFVELGAEAHRHFPDVDFMPAVLAATEAMQRSHPGRRNRDVFNDDFLNRTGIDLDRHRDIFDRFYRDSFPLLGDGTRPAVGAQRAIATARDLGLTVVVATQPIFPRVAIEARLRWAGLEDAGLDLLTTYEIMTACKPLPAFFHEAAGMAGCDVHECIMVGNDPRADMAAADVGMRTFYVGDGADVPADWRGDLNALADLLPRLALAPDTEPVL